MNRSHENSLQPGKSFYLDNKTELKKRNQLPAGIKIKDILSGKYKPTSRSKLIHFKNATAEQRKAFHAKNLPQRCLQNYHTLAHPAGMVINELVQLRNLKIEVCCFFAFFDNILSSTKPSSRRQIILAIELSLTELSSRKQKVNG